MQNQQQNGASDREHQPANLTARQARRRTTLGNWLNIIEGMHNQLERDNNRLREELDTHQRRIRHQ